MNHDELPEFIKNSNRTSGVQYFNNYSGDSRKFAIWCTGLNLSYTDLFGVIQSVVIKYFDGYTPKQDIFLVDGRVIKLTTAGADKKIISRLESKDREGGSGNVNAVVFYWKQRFDLSTLIDKERPQYNHALFTSAEEKTNIKIAKEILKMLLVAKPK